MANAGTIATSKALQRLLTPGGLKENLEAVAELNGVALTPITATQVLAQNVAQTLVERSLEAKYPTLLLYCEKLKNELREKFRTFSGKAQMAIEVRVSQDRLEGLDWLLSLYVDAVTRILDQNRGDWGGGAFYTGGYEASFGEVSRGGRNFIQTGKIRFDLNISVD